jgi:hypothetical protein
LARVGCASRSATSSAIACSARAALIGSGAAAADCGGDQTLSPLMPRAASSIVAVRAQKSSVEAYCSSSQANRLVRASSPSKPPVRPASSGMFSSPRAWHRRDGHRVRLGCRRHTARHRKRHRLGDTHESPQISDRLLHRRRVAGAVVGVAATVMAPTLATLAPAATVRKRRRVVSMGVFVGGVLSTLSAWAIWIRLRCGSG